MNTLTKRKKFTARDITFLAVMAALSVVLVALIRWPWPPAPFLEYDPAAIPIFIVTFAFGPAYGLVITIIASVIQGLTVSAATAPIGIIMHIAATGTAVIVAGNIYKRMKSKRGAVVSLVAAVATMSAVMMLMNVIFTPLFMIAGGEMDIETARTVVIGMLASTILPFNLFKGGVNAAIAFVVYKAVGKLFRDNWERKKKPELQEGKSESTG